MNHPDYYSWTTGRAWLLVSASMSGSAETEPDPFDPLKNKFERTSARVAKCEKSASSFLSGIFGP